MGLYDNKTIAGHAAAGGHGPHETPPWHHLIAALLLALQGRAQSIKHRHKAWQRIARGAGARQDCVQEARKVWQGRMGGECRYERLGLR